MTRFIAVVLALASLGVQAAPWTFDAPLTVSEDPAQKAYFHLDASGRKSIAVSGAWIGVTWEDNRDGQARCYLALKGPGTSAFGAAQVISGKDEAFQPSVVGLGQGKFALAWEEAGQVRLREVSGQSLGPVSVLALQGSQVSLYANEKALYAVWAGQVGKLTQIQFSRLARDKKTAQLIAQPARPVERARLEGDQNFPSVYALTGQRVLVAWEDRRAGHTRIVTAYSPDDGRHFGPTRQLNDLVWRGQMGGFGRGTGVMRVALSSDAATGVAAVWADKRDFLAGYDVYAALASGQNLSFKANEKVQDQFGDAISQWHPAIGASPGLGPVIAWDDDRDGNPDIWLAWRLGEGWSDNLAVPGASGPGVQSDPSLILESNGDLHLVWVDKAELNSPSRLRYVHGRREATPAH